MEKVILNSRLINFKWRLFEINVCAYIRVTIDRTWLTSIDCYELDTQVTPYCIMLLENKTIVDFSGRRFLIDRVIRTYRGEYEHYSPEITYTIMGETYYLGKKVNL